MGSQAWSALSVVVSFRNCSWPGVVLSRPLSSYDGNLLIGSVWWLVQGLLGCWWFIYGLSWSGLGCTDSPNCGIVEGWHVIWTIAASGDLQCWQTLFCTFPAPESTDVSVSGTFLRLDQFKLRTIGTPASLVILWSTLAFNWRQRILPPRRGARSCSLDNSS